MKNAKGKRKLSIAFKRIWIFISFILIFSFVAIGVVFIKINNQIDYSADESLFLLSKGSRTTKLYYNAIGEGEHKEGEHGGEGDRTALRHLIKTDVGEDKGQRDAQRCVGHHANAPFSLVRHDAVKDDTDQDKCGEDSPYDGRNFCKLGKHEKTPFGNGSILWPHQQIA